MDITPVNTAQFDTSFSSSSYFLSNNLDPFNSQPITSNSLTFLGTDNADNLYLKVGVGQVIEYSTDGSHFYQINGLAFSQNTNISVNLGSGNDSLYIDNSLVDTLKSTGAKFSFDGGQGNDSLFGPNLDTTWYVTGQNSGNFSGIEFNNVENLKASANNYATFVFTPDGNLSGVADGGDGNLGTLVLEGGTYNSAKFIANGPHSGEILLDTKTIRYDGLAPIFDNTITADRVFTATDSNDQVLITKATTGKTTILSSNGTFESITFWNPSNSLTIKGLKGDDTITLDSLDPNFTKSLVIDGNEGQDSVIFAQNLTLNGGNLTVNAENITVNNGVTINTTKSGGVDGAIAFIASDTESDFNASGQVQINLTGATIKAGSINMSATSTVAGSVTSLPVALVNLDSTANISVINSHIESSGNVSITSSSTVTGTALAQGLSSYVNTAADAAVATSIINSAAIAYISGSSSIIANGTLSVTATNNINATTIGDASGAKGGAGIAVATITNTTKAYIDGSSSQGISAANIILSADSNNNIATTAKASPGGSTQNDQNPLSLTENQAKTSDGAVNVAGALAFTKLNSQTQAYISTEDSNNPTIVNTSGKLIIHAASNNSSSAIADSSNVGSNATGVGVAVAVSVVDITNNAYIDGNTSTNAGEIEIAALTPTNGSFTTNATSGSGNSSKVGVAGALAVHNLSTNSQAQLKTDAVVDANGGDVSLTATNQGSSTVKAEAAQAGSGTVGIGASIGLEIEQNRAEASLQNEVVLNNAGTLSLAATSDNSSNNSVKAGAAGGIAVSPALALTIVSNETLAIVGSGDTLIVDSIDAQATHTGKSSAIADAAAAGDKVGIGGALGLNFVDDKTIATTKRNITATTGGVAFGAFAYASSEANAKAGAAGADPEASKAEGQNTAEDQANGQLDSVDDPDAAKHKEQLAGKAETNDGSVSIAAGLAVNVANSSTQASLADGIVINAAGEFKLATSNETDASAIADGTMVGAAPQVGIGVAVALNIVNATNEATIGQSLDGNANVTAQGITLEAKMSDPNLGGDGISDFTAEATSGAGAKSVGVAGSFALNLIGANPSIASINSGAIVDAGGGDVTLVAENNTKSITKAEAAQTAAEDGAPSVGVGASFALDIEHNRAEASLADNVTLLNAGQLTLNATSNTTSETSVQAGSAGKISVSPAVALTIVSNDTIATIGTGGELIVGSLEAIAQHSGNTTTTADASAAGESVGIGATLALNIVDDTTIATTQRNITSTTGGVVFEAHAFAATGATATASSAGAAPAEEEAAPTGETTSGTTTPAKSAPPKTAEEQIGTQLDGASKNDPDSAQYKDDVNGKAKSNSDGAVSIAAALSLNLARSTTAATLSDNLVINAAGEFKLNASNETDGSAVADGSAVDGSNQIGIGAAVALNIVKASNQATIGTGAQVTANGITLEAQMSDESLNGDGVSNFTAESTSGAGAENVGVSGSFALNFVNNSNEAVIKSGAIVDAGSGDITLVAASNEIDDVKATSEATSGNVGVGASIGLNLLLSNPVRAEIEDSVTLSGSGALTLNAKSDRIVTTTVEAGSSGGTAVSPAVAVAIVNNDTTARLGAGTGTLNLSGDVNIKAEHTGAVLTSGDATAAGEKVAVGAIVAVNVSTDNTTATLMRDLTTSGGNVVIESQSALSSSAKVLASASGNKQEGRNADDEAKAQSGQSTLPSAQDSVNSSNNSANSASSDPSGNSASGGTSGAGVGVAAAVGVNWQKATNKAVIGDNIRIITEGGAVTVSAQSQTNATARAIGTSLSSKAKANVSAAVGLNIADVNNIASVGSQAIINAQSSEGQQGDITIEAVTPNQESNEFVVWGLAASGGNSENSKASIAGSVGVNVLTFNNQALVGNGAQLSTLGAVSVTANSPIVLQTLAISGAFSRSGGSGGGAAGAAIAVNIVNQNTTASIGANTTIDASESISISSISSLSPRTVTVEDVLDLVDATKGTIALPSLDIPGIDQLLPKLTELAEPIIDKLRTVISDTKSQFAELGGFYDQITSQLDSLIAQSQSGLLNPEAYVTKLIDLAQSVAPNIPGVEQISARFEEVAEPIVAQLRTLISEGKAQDPQLTPFYAAAENQLNALITEHHNQVINAQEYLTELTDLAKSVSKDFFTTEVFPQIEELAQPILDQIHAVINSGKNVAPGLASFFDQVSSTLDSLVNQNEQGLIDFQAYVNELSDIAKSLAWNFFKNLGSDILQLLPFSSIAIGAAVSDGKLGVGGSAIIDIFNVDTIASIGSGTQINQNANTQAGSNQSVNLLAADTTKIKNIAGGLGVGTGAAGIGIGVDLELFDRNVSAYIDSLTSTATNINAAHGISVQSSTDEDIFNLTLSAAGAGKLAVAGTVAVNQITNNVIAGIAGTIATQGDVSVTATDNSKIQALAGGLAVAAKLSEGGPKASIGAAVAVNRITSTIKATIDKADVTADGTLSVNAHSDAVITSVTIAGSASVSKGDSAGSFAAGASVAINKIKSSIIGAITDGSTILVGGQNLAISAKDNSTINAFALGGAIAVAASSGTGATLAIGVSAAKNEINNTTAAYIDDSTVSSSNDTDVNLDLQALSTNTISAQSIAVAISVAKGSTGIALSGGGAGSGNYILTKTNAYVKDSNLDHIGNVAIKANNTSNIDATVVAVSGSVAIGDSTGAAAAIGAAVANNFIGYEEDSDRNPSEVQAYIQNSSVQASGDLILNALANENIIARVGAGSIAVAASSGSTGISGSGSGVVTLNKIATLVKAFVDGAGDTGIQAKSATLTAKDSSNIKADAGAASIAVAAASTTGGSLSIGVSVASNLISNEVEAFINNADTSFETTTGGISLSATTNPIIEAVSVAASIAVGAAGTTGVGISGAGAAAINTILTKTNAYIKDSVVTSAGAVTLAATNTATIDAKIAAVSVAVGGGGTTGVGVSIGMAVANNFIGYDDSNRQPIEVQAYIQNSSLETNQDLKLTALSGGTITAGVGAGSAAVSGGGTTGVAAGGSGVVTLNKIATLVKAFIDGDGATGIQAKSATFTATDSSTITADAGAASLAIAGGGTTGVSFSIGVSIASNLISNEVEAFVNNANDSLTTTTGLLSLTATTNATIKAVSVAASIAAGGGGTTGVTISGAGAAAINTILTKTNAYIKDSVVASAEAVTLAATNSATIDATIAAVSISAGGGGTAGVGVSIGAAVANNFIGYDDNGNRTPAEVQAYIQNSSLAAGGDLTLTALSTSTINAGVGAGSAAISGGGTAGVAASGSGVSTENKIATLIKAFIDGDGATGIQTKSATLTAQDSSSIKADAGAASVAASFSGTASVSLSIGVALAHNVVTNEVEAYIQNADNFVKTATGNVSLSATTDGSIQAVSVAASVSVGISGTAGIAVSGAGAESTNSISTKTNAYIKDSAINSAGAVNVTAQNTAGISAKVVAASAAVGASGTAGVAASIGVAIARNLIGWDVNVTDTNYKYTTASGEQSVNQGDRVLIAKGARAGDIYEFIGDPATINLQNADYAKTSDWKQVNLKQYASEVLAYVNRSSINAAGTLNLSSLSNSTIEATVASASMSIAGGIGGASLSGSGVSTENKIATKVQAYIDGDGSTGISASNINVTATDTSSIAANAEAVSIGVTIAIGGAISFGISLARNEISNDVAAFVENINNDLTATSGGIQLKATETSTITAISVAASAAIGLVGVAGAGAEATNTIANAARTHISDAVQVQANGGVGLTSSDNSIIRSLAGQFSAGTAAAIGVSVATNTISNQITAEIANANVISTTGAIALSATSNNTIETASIGGSVGGTVAAAGAVTLNKIRNTIKAGTTGVSTLSAAGAVTLAATDTSTIASLGGQLTAGGAAAVGAAVTTNDIANNIIAELGGTAVTAASVTLTATSTSTIDSIAAGGSGAGAFAAGGAVTVNNFSNTVRANIANGSNVQSQGNVSLTAINSATVQSLAGQIAGAGGAAIGASVAINNSANITQAYISDSTVASGGQVKALAQNTGIIKSKSAGASVAGGIALTGSVSVNNITNTTDAHAKNAVIFGINGVEISATDTATIQSFAGQISVGIGAAGVGAAVAYNNIGNIVTAYVTADDGKFTTIETSGNAIVSASGRGIIDTIAAGGSLGLFVGAGASVAVNEMSNNISAFVNNSSIIAQGSVGILADSTNSMITTGGTLAGGLVGLGATIAVNNLANITRAYVNNASIDGVGKQSINIPKTDGTGSTESFQGVAVVATSKDELGVTIGTGGAGLGTFVASIAVNSFQNTTEAYTKDVAINAITGSSVPEQSVYIKAFNDSTVNVNAGTVGVGLAAAGVAIDITTMKNATSAYIDSTDLINSQGSVVNANKDLVVEAKTQKLLTSNVVAFGGGLGFSVQGAVSIINVSSGMSDDGNEAASDTQSKVDQQLTDLNKMGKDSNGNSNISTKAVFNTLTSVQGTTAFIAGTASAGSNLTVNAYETTNLDVSVTGASAGLLGAGAGIGIANITHNASAYVGANSNINGFKVTIQSTGFVESTTVTAKAGAAGGLALGAAVAYLTSNNNSKAYIGENAKVNINGQAEVVNVIANSVSKLATDGQGVAVGALAVGVVLTKTEETGATSAYLDQGVQVQNTNNLNVTANVDESVTATATAAGGGIISGNGVDVRANVNPNVTAYIGDNNTINVAKDINVRSNVTVDGDAAAKGASYGLLAVGLAFSEVNSNPTINTYVGTNTTIEAGNVTIASSLGKAPVTADTSFDPANAVNNTSDSITFANSTGLKTGDTVVYSNGGNGATDIDGLTDQHSYSVIVDPQNDKVIKLGSEFDGASVDTKFNTITFANGHSFTQGEQVVYEKESGTSDIGGLVSGTKYYVNVIDGKTIQLSLVYVDPDPKKTNDITEGASLADITTVSGATTIQGKVSDSVDNVFANGDTVVYKKHSSIFTVDDKLADGVNENGENVFNTVSRVISDDSFHSYKHGFETGDQVVYTATGSALGGLTSNTTYYVIKDDDDHFKLAKTESDAKNGNFIDITSATGETSHKITAVGLKANSTDIFSSTASSTISLTNHGLQDGQAVIYQSVGTGTDTSGLTNGQTYYVKLINANSFGLSATKGGSAITLATTTQKQSLTTEAVELQEGVSYYVVNSTATTFQLSETKGGSAIGLDKTGLTGTGSLHTFIKQSAIDLTSVSTGMYNLHIDLNTGTATGTKHQLSSGAAIVLPSQGDQVFSVYSQASSGAAIAGSGAKATINITSAMNTYVGNSAVITTTGDVKVQGLSNIQLTGAATTKTGGLLGIGIGKLNATINNNNSTDIKLGARIKADGNVTIDGQSSNKFNLSSDSTAGGLIAAGSAETTLTVNHNTITTIADQVSITSQRDLLVHSSSDTSGSIKADASGGGLVPFAYGTATLNVNGVNQTNVNAATLEARTLTIESAVDNLNVNALGLGTAAGLIGIIQAKSNIYLNDTSTTTNIGSRASLKADELNLTAIFRNVNTNSTALAHCDGLGGKTDSDATNESNLKATVNTDANSTLTVNSLNVKSGFDSFNNTNYAYSKKAWELRIWTPFGDIVITLDFGSANTHGSQNATSTTNFKSNVVRLARAVNPVLSIDASGKVSLKSDNVTVTDNGTDINVANISADGGGKVTFSSGAISTDGSFSDNGKYSAIDPAFDSVEIQNYSNKNLIINDISTIAASSGYSSPDYSKVNVSKTINATSSSSSLATNPTLVTINNWGTSNLILKGVIDNPHDRTILYSGGNIFSQGSAQNIITRDLTITALNGSIGANGRINAQLNQGYTPVTSDVTDSNIYLSVEAQNSTYLNLTAKSLDNQPATVNVKKMTANTGEVNLAIGQTTNQANTSISALYKFTDAYDFNQNIIAGTNIVINAGSTTTDIDAKTIFLSTTASLDIVTGGSIHLKNTSDGVNLKQLISHQDAINLSGMNFVIVDDSVVQAAKDITLTASNLGILNNATLDAGTDITLLVANNFQLNSTATINAGNNVVIQGDYNNQNPNGASISIDGWINAQNMYIYGNNNQDTFNIQRLATTTYLYTGGGDDIVNIGSSQNRTNEIQKHLTMYGETQTDVDTLNIDNSGDTSNSIGVLTDTSLTGLGMGEGIYYNGFESLNINLGTGNDDFTILNTSATTNIDSNAGDDKFRIGVKVDTNGNILDEIVDGILIPGINILGTSNITNIKTGAGKDYIQVNRNTAVLNIQGGIDDDTFEVNTPINYSVLLTNAQVNLSGNDGNDKTIINGSSLLEAIQNNGSSVEVVNSRFISVMTNEILVINGNTSGTGSSDGSSNTTDSSDAILSRLYDRTVATSSNTNTTDSSNAILSRLYDRTVVTSSNNNGITDPLLLALFSR